MRNFTFNRLDVIAVNPEIPYKLSDKNYVNYWFPTADAPDVAAFNRLPTETRSISWSETGACAWYQLILGKGLFRMVS